MSTLTFDGAATAARPAIERSKADALRIAALALPSIRFIQGFIYWGGGSACVYRKLKPGRNGDEARRVSGVNE